MKNIIRSLFVMMFLFAAGNLAAMDNKMAESSHVEQVERILKQSENLAFDVECQYAAAVLLRRQEVVNFLCNHETYKNYIPEKMKTRVTNANVTMRLAPRSPSPENQ